MKLLTTKSSDGNEILIFFLIIGLKISLNSTRMIMQTIEMMIVLQFELGSFDIKS